MTPSIYQQRIFESFDNSTGNKSIVAVAGSGKSTTLEHLVRRIPHANSVLVVAFNRDIVIDLKPRMAHHPKCDVQTLNAFGSRVLRAGVMCSNLDEDKSDNALGTILRGIYSDEEGEKRYWKWKFTVKRLMDLFRANLRVMVQDSQILDTMDDYSLDLPYGPKEEPDFLSIVGATYHKMLEWTSIPDFRDQVFMPIHLNLPIPKYDVVLVDEDQDLDPCQAELVIRAALRLVMVGDPEQAIYRFRGAMADAVTSLESRMNAERLPLSVCYRCPKSVIKLAKQIVPQIEACDWATEGIIADLPIDKFRLDVREGDLVLCRTTKPLVAECLSLIRAGKRAKVKGREIGTQLKGVVDRIGGSSLEEFNKSLTIYFTEQMERFAKLKREQQMIDLSDRVETIRAILESCTQVRDINIKIDSLFTDKKDEPGVKLMTCHKSKGLENPRVFILAPELLPHPRAKKPEDVKVEMNLRYVAITRCKFVKEGDKVIHEGELYFVKETNDGKGTVLGSNPKA